jgi:hypothetical protein
MKPKPYVLNRKRPKLLILDPKAQTLALCHADVLALSDPLESYGIACKRSIFHVHA